MSERATRRIQLRVFLRRACVRVPAVLGWCARRGAGGCWLLLGKGIAEGNARSVPGRLPQSHLVLSVRSGCVGGADRGARRARRGGSVRVRASRRKISGSWEVVLQAQIISGGESGRGRGQQVVCSRAEQRASPPVLYSPSGGYRRTAKAPIACDLWDPARGVKALGRGRQRYFLGTFVCYAFFTEESPRLGS